MKPEKLRAVMLAKGPEYVAMAELTRPRAEKALGVSVELITDIDDPFDAKLSLLDDVEPDEHVMLLDTDLVFFGWDWNAIVPDKFNAAIDMLHPSWPGTKAITDLMPYPNEPTFNTGLWIAPGSLWDVFHVARHLMHNDLRDFPYRVWDQTPLNLALQQTRAPRNPLHAKRFNWQVSPRGHFDPPPHPITLVVHLIEGTSPQSKLERVAKYCKAHPLRI